MYYIYIIYIVLNNEHEGNVINVGLLNTNIFFHAKLNYNILVIWIATELRFYLLTYFQPLKFYITDSKVNEVIIIQ